MGKGNKKDENVHRQDIHGGLDDMLATASLEDLQSKEYRQILDMVDRLRTCGLGSILPLPQLVVCGNQSSGKSSVLEAITEVPFPRKENLCTRFATEIILRRDLSESIHTKIIPDSSRPESEKEKLAAFSEVITDFSDLPELIEKATDLMGLNAANAQASDQNSTRAFSRDVLSVEIAGPGRPQLTLVDLPGLILSANKDQTEADIKLIHSLVGDYISEKRTIMLAVISAKDDHANQGILTKCKEVDKDGQRTLGIITKPDYLRAGSANEKTWINLAHNNDIYFELGWHMLKNRDEEDGDSFSVARNASERSFFSAGLYRSLPEGHKGIDALRSKLSKLLFKHLKKELPNLQKELNAKHDKTLEQLLLLGDKRSTLNEQKRFLTNVASKFQGIIKDAVDGNYEGPFFGPINITKGFDDAGNMRRLRAAVQHLNSQFASQMRQYGHKFRIWATEETAGTNSLKDLPEPKIEHEDYAKAQELQEEMSREAAVDWVRNILVRTRGREVAGNYNPLLMAQLFREQSKHWEQLATAHIQHVAALCSAVVRQAIGEVVFSDVSEKIQVSQLDEALAQHYNSACKELGLLITDKGRSVQTYDPSYTAKVQESRRLNSDAQWKALIAQATVEICDEDGNKQRTVNPDVFQNSLKELQVMDMDKQSAEDALDSMLAYYKDKVKYFITAVTDQVIERHLLGQLVDGTISPTKVNDMSDSEISYVAAEAEEVAHKRAHLEGHKSILESGQNAFREAMRSYK